MVLNCLFGFGKKKGGGGGGTKGGNGIQKKEKKGVAKYKTNKKKFATL